MGHAMGATAWGGMDALLNPITTEGLDQPQPWHWDFPNQQELQSPLVLGTLF